MANEKGYPICHDGREVKKGQTVMGSSHNVSIPLNTCPPGSRVIGVHHTHPGGSLQPSDRDISTMREKNLQYMCVGVKNRVVCFKNRRFRRRG